MKLIYNYATLVKGYTDVTIFPYRINIMNHVSASFLLLSVYTLYANAYLESSRTVTMELFLRKWLMILQPLGVDRVLDTPVLCGGGGMLACFLGADLRYFAGFLQGGLRLGPLIQSWTGCLGQIGAGG